MPFDYGPLFRQGGRLNKGESARWDLVTAISSALAQSAGRKGAEDVEDQEAAEKIAIAVERLVAVHLDGQSEDTDIEPGPPVSNAE